MTARHFLKLADFSKAELIALLERATWLKQCQRQNTAHQPLLGKTLAMVFEQASTRTRVSFEVGMNQLGGNSIFLTSQDMHLGRGELIRDTAIVLSGMVDAVMIRTQSHANLEAMAKYSTVPVINGMTSHNHPCQLLADLQTYREHRGNIEGAKVAFLGDGFNMCNSYIEAAKMLGFHLRIAGPKGYEPDARQLAYGGDFVKQMTDPVAAVAGANLVVTDVWTSLAHDGCGADAKARRLERLATFADYQVTPKLMDQADADALFMHCLPAHWGEEINESMFADRRTVIWDEAENRMHSQKALLEALLVGEVATVASSDVASG